MAKINHNDGIYSDAEWSTVKTMFPKRHAFRRHVMGLHIADESMPSPKHHSIDEWVTYIIRVLAALGLALFAAIILVIVSMT